jgi:hypothetical protein
MGQEMTLAIRLCAVAGGVGKGPARSFLFSEYLGLENNIVAEIARYSGDMRRVVWSQYSPKETLKNAT